MGVSQREMLIKVYLPAHSPLGAGGRALEKIVATFPYLNAMKHLPKVTGSLLIFALFFACGTNPDAAEPEDAAETTTEQTPSSPTLTKVWETDTSLTTVESVYYDPAGKRLIVSNMEENPWEKDGQGSLGLVSLTGEVTNPRWVTGLNAPKGSDVHDGKLYVADIDAVAEIDLAEGQIVKRHAVPEATGLNDVSITDAGMLYVSDSHSGQLHELNLNDGNLRTVVEDVPYANGVLVLDDGMLLLGSVKGGKLFKVDPASGEKTIFAEGVNPDGIVSVGNGNYVISRWNGQVHYVTAEGETTLLLDTEPEEVQSADIGFYPEERLVLVPTFFSNKVVAYRLE